jgi:hypothetical protein
MAARVPLPAKLGRRRTCSRAACCRSSAAARGAGGARWTLQCSRARSVSAGAGGVLRGARETVTSAPKQGFAQHLNPVSPCSRVALPVHVLAADRPRRAPPGRQEGPRLRVRAQSLHSWCGLQSGDLGVGVRVMRPAGRSQSPLEALRAGMERWAAGLLLKRAGTPLHSYPLPTGGCSARQRPARAARKSRGPAVGPGAWIAA